MKKSEKLSKQVIGIIFGILIVLLFVTKSMYVDWVEIYIMIGCLSAVSIVYNLLPEERHSYGHVLVSSAIIGFFFSIVFSFLDLIFDHYKVIKGVADGRHLTLNETISEFSDDLIILALIVMFSVTLISYFVTIINSRFFRKQI